MNILLAFVSLTIFTLMLTIGLNRTFQQLTALWHDRSSLLTALLAVLVLVPAVAYVLLLAFSLPIEVATGLALLAASPGAPLTTKRAQMVHADPEYVSGLQLTLALLAVIVTPILLSVFYASFPLETQRVSALSVARQIAMVTFLPVLIGLALQHFAPALCDKIRAPVSKLADILFLLLVVGMLAVVFLTPELRAKLLIGWSGAIVIVIMAIAAVTIGHFLGGPAKQRRGGLAVACLARNVGLALFIAGLSEDQHVIPTLVVYIFLGVTVQASYGAWLKRQP